MDKKSKHVGNHGGRYTDIDGMSKQFTYIDHDKKTTVSTFIDVNEPFDQKAYRGSVIKRITDISASLCPSEFVDFTLRGQGRGEIEWNTDMLIDDGLPTNRLRELCAILENRNEGCKFIL